MIKRHYSIKKLKSRVKNLPKPFPVERKRSSSFENKGRSESRDKSEEGQLEDDVGQETVEEKPVKSENIGSKFGAKSGSKVLWG